MRKGGTFGREFKRGTKSSAASPEQKAAAASARAETDVTISLDEFSIRSLLSRQQASQHKKRTLALIYSWTNVSALP